MRRRTANTSNNRTTRYRHGLDVDFPTIRILLYADDPDDVTESTAKEESLSLGLMLEHLRAHAPVSARLDPRYVCRYRLGDPKFIDKLNSVLGRESFDEIWFFGINQINLQGFSLGFFQGGPENELDAAERAELERVMGAPGVGVLITGDHSNERPTNAAVNPNPPCADGGATAAHLGLGRAIGRCVPRAGLLRKWDDQPTNLPGELITTVAQPGEEFDETAQALFLRNVNADGEPDPQGEPHPLFFYKPGQFITSFPDHTHEGSLDEPDTVDITVWPQALQGSRPLPNVVAYGINHRTAERTNLVAAYHGDRAGVGRIVADSTWHHYFNFNLLGFPSPAPEGSAADQIGQFYANLAVWLAPISKRREMAHAMFWQLAKYTMRLEHRSDDAESELTCGRAADAVFSRIASPCEVHELLQAVTPEQYEKHGKLKFSEGSLVLSDIPPRQLLLGSIMCSYHDEMLRANNEAEGYQPLGVDRVMASAFTRAFKKQVELLNRKREDALKFLTNDL